MRRFFTLLIIIGLGIGFTAKGQTPDITSFMQINPFQNFDNPSCSTIYDGYVSLPTGQIHVGFNFGPIRYNNLFETNADGYPVTITANKFVNKLSKNNLLGFNASMELWGFGFRAGKKFFITMDHRLRINGDIRYSKDLFGLPVLGNMAYVDDPANINLCANINAYQELGISFRHEVNEEWSWGVRPKLLMGLANLRTERLSALLYTDPDSYELTMQYDALIKAAAIVPFSMTFDREHGFSFETDINAKAITANLFKNPGFGIDLGLSYRPIPELNLSFSAMDLGFIFWKSSATEMTSQLNDAGPYYNDGSLVFSGLTEEELQVLIDGGNAQELLDTLAYYFPLDVHATDGYVAPIPARVALQADYEFAKGQRVSAAAQLRFASHYVQPSLTIAYDGCFFNMIDVCVAYTMQRRSFDNLGIGLGFNLGYLNIYFGTQNLISALNYRNCSRLTATAGLVFNWGHMKELVKKKPKKQE